MAESGFLSMHVSQVHWLVAAGLAPKEKPLGVDVDAGFAPNEKPPLGGVGSAAGGAAALGAAPGLGASHTMHFSVAVEAFFSMHVVHSHSPAAAGFGTNEKPVDEAGLSPVEEAGLAPNEKPPAGGVGSAAWGAAALGAAPGRGASQTVHFSLAESGFWSMQVSQVH